MFVKSITVALTGAALLVTAASAQTPMTPTDRARMAPAASESSLHGEWRASKMVGLNVYNDKNESIGSINDLLTDRNGNIKAVVLGVGGFLGVGEHLVAVAFDKIKFVNEPVANTGTAASGSKTTTGSATSTSSSKTNTWYPDHAVFNATKEELKAMPEFKYST